MINPNKGETIMKKSYYNYLVGKAIRIVNMRGEDHYEGRVGIVKSVDDIGQLHGTWGDLAIIPEEDDFIILRTVI